MLLSRRSVLKNLLIIAGGVAVIPSCMQETSKASILLHNIKVNATEEKMLADLSETLIPTTDTPGAKDMYTHLFLLKMIDDCTAKEDQQKFLDGLKGFEAMAKKRFDKSFSALTPAERTTFLGAIEAQNDVPEDVQAFYKSAKRLTIQGFVTSKYYMTEVQPYQLVPGKFNGCAPVKPSNKKAYKA